ncbi:tyrosine recombinase XerC [Clostridia bacterium]|nr:tyrosine recombinase XerC [Clostridia bacterium]GHV11976.1 tyrosine recombinase XerC [Clostridia bacterium]
MTATDLISALPPLAREFLQYNAAIKARSGNTVSEYALDLRVFFRYMARRFEKVPADADFDTIDVSHLDFAFISSVTTEDVLEFLFYVKDGRHAETCARARKLTAVKQFFKYLTNHKNILDRNPAEHIDTPTLPLKLPKFLSLEECEKLFAAIESDTASLTRTRDICVVTLFLNCGMRVSELCNINLTDISSDLDSIRILGKRRKERFVYLNNACKNALTAHLKERQAVDSERLSDKNAVFISKQYKRISRSMIEKLLDKYLLLAGLADKNYSPHKLRHTAATLLYQYGEVDTKIIQELLGHESLATTQIYTHVANRAVSEAVAKNPLAKRGVES